MKTVGFFRWLFTGKNADVNGIEDPSSACTAEDYEEFINYLRGRDRAFSKPGRSIKEEFKFWLADRNKKQAQTAAYSSARAFAAATQK